ncbi:MAG: IS200/IS605 family transposase [Bacteroidota bacterium]
MSHSLTKIWIHAVFGTKHGEPFINPSIEAQIHAHIREHLEKDFECPVKAINSMPNHLHILFLLNVNFAVKDILKNIKGESSHWVNNGDLIKGKFAWQTGYGAFSVSESNVGKVEQYIRNQKEHHRKHTFANEYADFMKKHGLQFPGETDKSVLE